MADIERLKTADLIPYARNSRKHSPTQIKKIAASIQEFGFTNPVLIDKDNGIIAGHARVMAAEKLKMKEVPCLRLGHLTKAQKKAYIIADNKLALGSEWDEEMLALELQDLSDAGFDLEITGFDMSEISPHLRNNEGLVDEDDVPEVQDEPVTQLGDIILLGNHRLMCGDSTDAGSVALLMDGQKADMVFTDPPYGIDIVQGKKSTVGGAGPTNFETGTDGSGKIVPAKSYKKIAGDKTTDAAKAFYQTCLDLGFENIVLWGGNYFTDFLYPSRCWIVWDKEMTGNFSEAEMAWTSFSKGGVKVFKFLWNGLSREGNRKDELKCRVHPTQKPVGLFQNIFERFDGFKSIYDGFGGSGSTLIACEKTNRKCYMMELDPHYCDIIIKRWEEYTGLKAERVTDRQEVANG